MSQWQYLFLKKINIKIFVNNNFETAQITTHVLHLNKNKINNK